jgi:hypothetical protein
MSAPHGDEPSRAAELDASTHQPRRPTRRMTIAVAAALGLVVVAGAAILGVRWTQDHSVAQSAPSSSASPSTSAVASMPAPPPPETEPPTDGLSPAALAAYDQKLIASLRSQHLAIADPQMTAHDAHLVCARLQNGQSVAQVKRDYAKVSHGDPDVADVFVSTVMRIYPSCP